MSLATQKVERTRRRLVRNRRIVGCVAAVFILGYIAVALVAAREEPHSEVAMGLVLLFVFLGMGRR